MKLFKILFGLLVTLMLFWTLPAWTQPAIDWEVSFDSGGDDSPRRIGRDAQGNTYILSDSHNDTTYRDIVVVKYDPTGSEVWFRTYNGVFGGDDVPFDMKVDAAGNVTIVGMTQTGLYYSDENLVILRYDTKGNLAWEKTYEGALQGFDAGYAVALDGAGNAIVAGTTEGISIAYGMELRVQNYLTLKYDANGHQLWERVYAGPTGDGGVARTLTTDPQGNIYVTGGAMSYLDGAVGYNIVTVKYSPTGAVLWTAEYGSLSSAMIEPDLGADGPAIQVTIDAAGNVYVLGTTALETSYPLYDSDVVLVKYAPNGALLWRQIWGRPGEESPRNMVVDAAGNITVAIDSAPAQPVGYDDTMDAAVVSFDANGNKRWDWVFNGPDGGEDSHTWVMLDNQDRPYAAFTTQTFESYDVGLTRFSANGAVDWLYRYDNPNQSDDFFNYGISDGAEGLILGIESGGFLSYDMLTLKMLTSGGAPSPPVLSVSLTPTQILPHMDDFGNSPYVEGTVTLSEPAPPGGATIRLTSDNPAVVVNPLVIVSAGQTSAVFYAGINGVDARTVVTITARGGDAEASDVVTVLPAALTEFTLPISVVVGGASPFGQVALNAFAGPGGATVTLKSSRPDIVTVPDSISIGPNDTWNSFDIHTVGVTDPVDVVLTASYQNVTLQQTLRVVPASLAYLFIRESYTAGGKPLAARVTLDGIAPPGGATITLSSSDPHVIPPAAVTVPAGKSDLEFMVDTLPVAEQITITVTATYRGKTLEAQLTLRPPFLNTLTLNPEAVIGGSPSEGTVTLEAPAPEGGIPVALSSSNPAATVPASVVVPAGAISATFPISTASVTESVKVNIIGAATATRQASLAVMIASDVPDTVTIQSVGYSSSRRRPSRLNVQATSTSTVATLRVYDKSTNTLIGTLAHQGGGKFYGSLFVTPKPANITVRSTLGGSASASVP